MPRVKLTETDVRGIKNLGRGKVRLSEIGKLFGVSKGYVSKLLADKYIPFSNNENSINLKYERWVDLRGELIVGGRSFKLLPAKLFYYDILRNSKCVDCGEADPVILEFDHRPGFNKIKGVSVLAHTGGSIEDVRNEIEKCEVRCSNCRRRVTHFRKNSILNEMSKEHAGNKIKNI